LKNINEGIMISNILVPTDGAEVAHMAARYGVDLAKQLKASVIVLSSHGRSALAAAFLGSVAYGVIHKDTKIPVLVVKR
jgi:nucleotide-binding universal stress UspA family protein